MALMSAAWILMTLEVAIVHESHAVLWLVSQPFWIPYRVDRKLLVDLTSSSTNVFLN